MGLLSFLFSKPCEIRQFKCDAPLGIGASQRTESIAQRIVITEVAPNSNAWLVETQAQQPSIANNHNHKWLFDGYLDGPSAKSMQDVIEITDKIYDNRGGFGYGFLRAELMAAGRISCPDDKSAGYSQLSPAA